MLTLPIILSLSFIVSYSFAFLHWNGYNSLARTLLNAKKEWNLPNEAIDDNKASTGLAYSLELPKVAGINWGSDLSFRWIYVQDLDAQGPAALSGQVRKVSQLHRNKFMQSMKDTSQYSGRLYHWIWECKHDC